MTSRLWPGVGSVRTIAPGIYADSDGNLHIAVRELLQQLGSEDSPKNRQTVADSLMKHTRQFYAGSTQGK